jgi:hypothetical protein
MLRPPIDREPAHGGAGTADRITAGRRISGSIDKASTRAAPARNVGFGELGDRFALAVTKTMITIGRPTGATHSEIGRQACAGIDQGIHGGGEQCNEAGRQSGQEFDHG